MNKNNVKRKIGCMIFVMLVFCLGQVPAEPCGDVNSDGSIDIVDALLIAQYYVGSDPANFDEAAADVNGDGSIDILDALLVAQYYVGLIPSLPGCEEPTPTPEGGTTTYELQAEDESWSSGGVDTNHDGYTGTGFVNTDNASGEWIEWSFDLSAGSTAVCEFRYASEGDDRVMDLSINGGAGTSLPFPASGAWNTWAIQATETVTLSAGLVTIRLTATTSGGPPNMDKMDITITGGVIVAPTQTPVPTPTPTADPNATPGPYLDEPFGWAIMGDGCTGGGNASPITVTSLSDLNSAAGGSDPRVIYVSGQFSGSLSVGSNKTIIGLPGAKITSASFSGSHNVILRNLILEGGTDTMNTNGATNLWFDHLDLSDGSDGVLDITHASDLITVSYTKVWYDRGGDHKNACLVGNSDGASGDSGKMRVTFYKCWWAEGTMERMPRVRYGRVHVLNNLYTCTGNVYCIAPGVHANIRAEKNIFIDVNTALAADWYNSSDDATLADIENVFLGSTTGTVGKYGDPVFVPPYPYTADEPNDALEAEIRTNAGATLDIRL